MVRLIHKQGEQSRSQKLNRWFFSLIYCINVLFLSGHNTVSNYKMPRSDDSIAREIQSSLPSRASTKFSVRALFVIQNLCLSLPRLIYRIIKGTLRVFVYHSHWLALIPLLQESDMVEHSFSWCYLIEIRPWKKVFWKCYQSIAFGLCLNIISEKSTRTYLH